MYSEISSNKIKTVLLIGLFIGFVGILGYILSLVSHRPGIFFLVGIGSLGYSIVSYFMSAKIALSMSGAQPVTKEQAPELYRIIENLSITEGVPMPSVHIINDPSPNAFATGRDPKHAAVAVTSGLLEIMDKEELTGVLAHELGHVKNYDIRLLSVVTALVSIVSFISDFFFNFSLFGGGEDDNGPNWLNIAIGLVMALLAPLAATVIQLAVSRRREYLADATGALTTRYPEGLARALEKISKSQPMTRPASATAHLYISNPFGNAGGLISRMFSTHPPIEDRIAKLRAMSSKA